MFFAYYKDTLFFHHFEHHKIMGSRTSSEAANTKMRLPFPLIDSDGYIIVPMTEHFNDSEAGPKPHFSNKSYPSNQQDGRHLRLAYVKLMVKSISLIFQEDEIGYSEIFITARDSFLGRHFCFGDPLFAPVVKSYMEANCDVEDIENYLSSVTTIKKNELIVIKSYTNSDFIDCMINANKVIGKLDDDIVNSSFLLNNESEIIKALSPFLELFIK